MEPVNNMNNIINELDYRINNKSILFFDLDDTLVYTSNANSLAYIKAIQQVIQLDVDFYFRSNNRFTRDVLKKEIPNLDEEKYERIIELKEKFYIEYLSETKLNNALVNVLKKYSKINETILVTNCREERAVTTLNYHGLIDDFTYKFYRQEKDRKYEYALNYLQISPISVIAFENEESEIKAAILAGILSENIISI